MQGEPELADAEDITTLDVFLAAYSREADGEILASVIEPKDDLLTLGVLRRILAARRAPAPREKAMREAPSDGTCRRCGAAPRSPTTGMCATCEDEDVERAFWAWRESQDHNPAGGIVPAFQAGWRAALAAARQETPDAE